MRMRFEVLDAAAGEAPKASSGIRSRIEVPYPGVKRAGVAPLSMDVENEEQVLSR